MIKVCHVITDKNIGGAGIWLINYLKNYDKCLIDIVVILPNDSKLVDQIEPLDVKVYKLKMAERSFDKGLISPLKQILRQEHVNILHTHASLSAKIAGKLAGIKCVYTKHCLDVVQKSALKRKVNRAVDIFFSRHTIAVSNAAKNNLISNGIKSDRITMIYNGIRPLDEINATQKALIKEKYGILPQDRVVGIVARLESVKDHKTFLQAARLIAEHMVNAKFLIVGGGSLKDELIRYSAELGIADKTVFTGHIDNVVDVMNILDINVLTSTSEALSISILEAMSLGKVTIATKAGGPQEIIIDGSCGYLVEIADYKQISNLAVKLLSDNDLLETMAQNAKQIIRDKFDIKTLTKKTDYFYKTLT